MKKLLFIIIIFFFVLSCYAEDETFVSTLEKIEDTLRITIAAVGDIMMGSDFPSPILPPSSGEHLFSDVKKHLKAEIVFCNLEGPLVHGGTTCKNIKSGRSYAFRTPPKYAKNLVDAGFNCVSLANNHIMDFGRRGITSTIKTLDSLNIKHSGPVGDIARFTIKGLKVGLVAFSTYNSTYNILNENVAFSTISSLSDSFDILIVSMHAGSEGTGALHTKDAFEYLYGEPRGNVVKFAHKAIENGADLILGHGPHVPRGLEIYRDRLIAYSLGNFCAYGRFSIKGATGKSLILKVKLKSDGSFDEGKIVSVSIKKPGLPYIDPENHTLQLIRELSTKDFKSNAPEIDEEGTISNSQFLINQ
ncbi:Capsule biosynthesis protein CapA [subsurface metagenome]